MQLKIRGRASGKIVKNISITPEDHDILLMDFLMTHGIPVASSCAGVGVCKKCRTSDGLLTCALSLFNYIIIYGDVIEFDYL